LNSHFFLSFSYIVIMRAKGNYEIKKEKIINSLQLPKDMMMGASIVSITGNNEAWIENYKGILEYTECRIVLQGKNCQICFEGKHLSIDYYTNEDMKISGCICHVHYQ